MDIATGFKKVRQAIASLSLATLLSSMLLTGVAQAAVADYTDVPASHWAYSSIMSLANAGVVKAQPEVTKYNPADSVTRAVMAQYLVKAVPLTLENPASPSFTDVAKDAWYYQPVETLSKNGVASGYKDANGNLTGKFGPADMVTRAQAAKMLVKAFNLKASSGPAFTDVNAGDWFYADVQTAAHWSLFAGNNGAFRPNDKITRAEMAKVIVAAQHPVEAPDVPVQQVGKVSVALATDNPAQTTLLTDTDSAGAMEASVPMLKLTFTNNGGEVKVNTLKFTRTGVAVDSDVNNLYLYEGNTKIAEMTSVSNKVYTFTSNSGLFTVSGNGTKTVWLGADIGSNIGTKSIGFTLLGAADVTLSDTSAVSGAFPLNGAISGTIAINDLGYVNLTNTTTFPATIDPGKVDQELWRFTATANSQKMQIHKIVLTEVGTISSSDLSNLKLSVGGVQVGATATLDSSSQAVFDLSATPYEIPAGQNKIFVLTGNVDKGTGRAFKFTIRKTADLITKDTNYNVYSAPLKAGAAFSVVDPDPSGDGTNINNGTLTINRAANSPNGNVAAGAIDVPLAKFEYKANGEDIKVTTVRVVTNEEGSDQHLDNGKLYYNGSQVGTTDTVVTDESSVSYSLGNSVIITAGTTGVFEFRADMTQGSGTALAADQTILVSLTAGTTDATGQTSLANVSTAAATGNTLTVKSGLLSVSKNEAVANATVLNPTGVVGATGVLVGSLTLTAGVGEDVNLTQVVVGDDSADATSDFGTNFQNLTLKNGTTQIATTQGVLSSTEGADYTFTLNPAVTIKAGETYTINAYADIKTGATEYAAAEVGLEFVSATATGVNTGTDATTGLSATDLQQIVVASSGSVTVTANGDTPVAGQLVMGETDATLAKLDFAAGPSEDVAVSVITVRDTTTFPGSITNIKLFDGATQLGSTAVNLTPDTATVDSVTYGEATFNLATPWVINRNTTKVLTIKGTVNTYGAALSGSSHTFSIASNAKITSRGANSGTELTETVSSAAGTAQNVYRTKVVADRAGSSPSGSQVVGANSNVLEFTVASNAAYDAVVNTVAVTMAGSANMTGTGDAKLYKSTDLVNALATESYKAITFDDNDGADGGAEVTFQENGNTSSACSAIPVGAAVRIYDLSGTAYLTGTFAVSAVDSDTGSDCEITLTGQTTDLDDGDILYYRPMQPGNVVYFGAQSALGANLADAATSVTVASTNGFAVGDTLYVAGYTAAGAAVTRDSGCVISSITSATAMTMSACQLSSNATIDYDYVSGDASNALSLGHNSLAIAYTGLVNSNNGQVVAAGVPMTFVVKGDTTSTGTAGTTANLRADIAAVGNLNWDDKSTFGVTTVTKNLPVTGGTLSYTY